MYNVIIFLHVLAVFFFLLTHGASVMVMLFLRREQNTERIRGLLDLSVFSLRAMYIFFVLLIIFGVIGGFMGSWWGRGWIWASTGLLILTFVAMGGLGSLYFTKIRQALGGLPYRTFAEAAASGTQPAAPSDAELSMLLNSSEPIIVALIGVVALALILYFMMLKPF
jgi:hypothetical protein